MSRRSSRREGKVEGRGVKGAKPLVRSVLKFDVDRFDLPASWPRRKANIIKIIIEELCDAPGYKCYFSQQRSRHGGIHLRAVIYHPTPWTAKDICKFQYCLGDDPYRSMRNYQRIRRKIKNWNKFYVPY